MTRSPSLDAEATDLGEPRLAIGAAPDRVVAPRVLRRLGAGAMGKPPPSPLLGITLAIFGWLAPPEPVEDIQVEPHHAPLGRLSTWFGPGIATGLTARHYGGPEQAPDGGQLAAATGLASLLGRVAGYAESKTRGSQAVRMLTPELMVGVEFGGTTTWRDAVAEQRGLTGREGFAGGISGVTSIGIAWASPGKVGVYGRVTVGQRFSARTNTNLEGPYLLAGGGPGFGMRVAIHRVFTLLVGGGIEGVAGVQRFEDRGRLIAQLAPTVELGLYTQPTPNVYFGFVARGDRTVLGREYGGQRLHGRASAEISWKVARTEGADKQIGTAAMLLIYDGTRIDASPGDRQFANTGERRLSHQLLLGGGFSF